MHSDTVILPSSDPARPVYRRSVVKGDGRGLWLYDHVPHTLPQLEEPDGVVATGSVMRRHPLRGDWAIYAGHRQGRPDIKGAAADPLSASRADSLSEIPFTDFAVAVFENRYPALHRNAPMPIGGADDTMPARGRCEVIVYSPDADTELGALDVAQRELVLHAWIDRYDALHREGAAFVMPFENRGREIGATLAHPHGQIYGFPLVPAPQAAAMQAFDQGYDLAAAVLEWGDTHRVEGTLTHHVVVPPFARFPYEVWIVPDRAHRGPWSMDVRELRDLAGLIGRTQRRLDALFGRPCPYMMTLQAAPAAHQGPWHFTVQFYPMLRDAERLKYLASVEQATGVFTVDIDPVEAAARLAAIAL